MKSKSKSKVTVYDIVTERILDMLDKGTVPWRKPWTEADMPYNLKSKKPYRGLNVWVLQCSGFSSPWWLTYKQATELGGTVKKGSHGTPVCFWSNVEKEDEATGEKKKALLFRYYTVFNVEQVEGIEEHIPQVENPVVFNPIEKVESLLGAMPQPMPSITHEGGRACYSPSKDSITIPCKEQFFSNFAYYSTLLHEIVHSTGHKSRLNREEGMQHHGFGSEDYSKEELVAEFGSSFLCALCGIEQQEIEQSAAYIANWSKRIQADKRMLVQAAAQAQKAVDYLIQHWKDAVGTANAATDTELQAVEA